MTKADIQLVRALADKRGRTEHGLFVAEGEKLIGELRGSHLSVRRIFSLEGVFEGPGVETVAPRDMERLSLLKTPNNSLALVEIPRCDLKPERLRGRLTLALDDVQNPGNLGTIIRLADWFGITDIVCSEASADCFNPKVVQATMGAILRVRVHYTDLAALLSKAAALGLPVCGTFLEGKNIYETELEPAGIVVMGNEGRGITDAVARMLPGVLSEEACFTEESHYAGLLEYPQYTRPEVWRGRPVPPVLLSGHHGNIQQWRRAQSLAVTRRNRPDLWAQAELSKEDKKLLEKLDKTPE